MSGIAPIVCGAFLHNRAGVRWRLWAAVAVLACLVAAAVFGWLWYARAEDRAATEVKALGGRLRWSDDRHATGHVVSISLNTAELQDADLDRLTPWWFKFPDLLDLDLSGTRVTDAGLPRLQGAKLHNLLLNRTRVGDAGMVHLGHLLSLRSLSLNDTQVGDAGLKSLASLKNLNSLYLAGTKVTDRGLLALTGLESLRYLRLGDNVPLDSPGVNRLRQALPALHVTH